MSHGLCLPSIAFETEELGTLPSPPCADDGKVWRCLGRMHPDTLDARVLCQSVRYLGFLYPSEWACTVP
jgi:hypothetical protein